MKWSDYWGALSSRQRIGLGTGGVLVAAIAVGLAIWLLRDPYEPLASGLSAEHLNEAVLALDRAKIDYRITASGDGIAVPHSQLGSARVASAGGVLSAPPAAGFELFNVSDFSANDFSQRINYQRALQGEITRTVQTIEGVRSARVHVVLADAGLFKRSVSKATAAVNVALEPGKILTQAQVRGIQRLVAASVPEIKIEDVVVLDETGASLTRTTASEGELSSLQLDLKRQADQYLEAKILRLLQEIVPHGSVSLSVDTALDEKQLRVTTAEPISVHGKNDSRPAAGVLIRERQSQRGHSGTTLQTISTASESGNSEWEYEYKVGERTEQMLSTPGSIRRISVAVAIQNSAGLSHDAIEELVGHAVGIDQSRGDSVAVVLLPALNDASSVAASTEPNPRQAAVSASKVTTPVDSRSESFSLPLIGVLVLALVVIFVVLLRSSADKSEVDIEATTAKVRAWLNEGVRDGRS